ncbi:cytochrome C oxidase subunit III (plasmid) [Bernardetia sp. Wsw4-3y2]|uniref:cytochrome c oxidase subunit 3 n=1 Tax=Bernardetia sp. Wsw4-3y2 TaxID=3127471 RepID=UPI0030CF6B6F
MQKQEQTNIREKKTTLEKMEQQHPYVMMMYLGVMGIFMAFTLLMLLFFNESLIKAVTHPIEFPYAFFISTIAIVSSSFFLEKARQQFYKDDFKKLRNNLLAVFGLGIVFLSLQIIGGYELHQNKIYLEGKTAGAYLYIISAFHMIHLMGGLVYLAILLNQYINKADDGVQILITVTNPYEKIKLQLLTIYWHFMDVLWVAIFVGFLIALI